MNHRAAFCWVIVTSKKWLCQGDFMASVLISFQVPRNLQQSDRQTPGWIFQQCPDKEASSEIRTGETEKFPFLWKKIITLLILILQQSKYWCSLVYFLEGWVILGKNLTHAKQSQWCCARLKPCDCALSRAGLFNSGISHSTVTSVGQQDPWGCDWGCGVQGWKQNGRDLGVAELRAEPHVPKGWKVLVMLRKCLDSPCLNSLRTVLQVFSGKL